MQTNNLFLNDFECVFDTKTQRNLINNVFHLQWLLAGNLVASKLACQITQTSSLSIAFL
jgi:hypothetical protein